MDKERPIERLLRQAGKSRLEQSGTLPNLHPANRRLLQDEVRRAYAKGPKARGWDWGRLWPRLSWATGIAVILGALIWVALPARKDVGTLAASDTRPREDLSRQVERHPEAELSVPSSPGMTVEVGDKAKANEPMAGMAAPKPAESEPLYNRRSAISKPGNLPSREEGDRAAIGAKAMSKDAATTTIPPPEVTSTPPPETALTDASMPSPEASFGAALRSERKLVARTAAPSGEVNYGYFYAKGSSAGPQAYPAAESPAASASMPATSASSNWHFDQDLAKEEIAQRDAGTLLLSKDSPRVSQQSRGKAIRPSVAGSFATVGGTGGVLEKFSIQQNGSRIFITDADGSLYSGEIEAGLPQGAEQMKRATLALAEAGLEEVRFKVTGTNATLGRVVGFSGTIVTPRPIGTNVPSRLVRGEVSTGDSPPVSLEALQQPSK